MSRIDTNDLKRRFDDPRGLCEALDLVTGPVGKRWRPQTGRNLHIACPWHSEHTPSCSVSRGPDGTVRVKCFSCHATGDALTLVAHINGLDARRDFLDVVDLACDLVNVQRPERKGYDARPPSVRAIARVAPPPLDEAQEDGGALAQVAAMLSHLAPATEDRAAMDYIRSRGLAGSEAEQWYALPTGAARDNIVAAIIEEVGGETWRRSGLASEAGWWSGAWGGPRLVIPWRGPDGSVNCLQGRYIGAGDKAKRFAFPAGRAPLWPYGSDVLSDIPASSDTAIAVTEGAIDAASFNLLAQRAGANAVAVALPSVQAWEPEWFDLFARRVCVSALDNDDAGARFTPDLVAKLRAVGRKGRVTVLVPSVGKDWNDVLRGVATPAATTTEAAQ